MAELGFIVVVVFNRGTERLRDRSFNEYSDPVLPSDPLHLNAQYSRDCIACIKQLAVRYPYMDISRVGVVELGHAPKAIAGMLLHPEFYKVGVSVNPCVDRNIKASMGMDYRGKMVPQLIDFAEKLEGKLLIIANILNPFLPVSMTFRLADALYKANKRFDMLVLPESGHSLDSGNKVYRCWDYLVEHLMGVEPPKNI